MTLERATDVFGAGFTYTRSFTHPFEYVRIGPLRVMRDLPRRSGDYRAEEILVLGISAAEAVKAIREYKPSRFFLCAIHGMDGSEDEVRDAYKAQHFRLLRREPLMVRSLDGVDVAPGPFPVVRIETPAQAEAVRQGAGGRQILPRDLGVEDANLRLYAAFDGPVAVGWVRSIRGPERTTWVSNMHVQPDYRRRGIASSLMTAMLVDDRRHGAEWSVLLASNAGAQLYPILGYRQIGLLQLFAPIKDRWS